MRTTAAWLNACTLPAQDLLLDHESELTVAGEDEGPEAGDRAAVLQDGPERGVNELQYPVGASASPVSTSVVISFSRRQQAAAEQRAQETRQVVQVRHEDTGRPAEGGVEPGDVGHVEIHWVRNTRTGQVDDFKFKDWSH